MSTHSESTRLRVRVKAGAKRDTIEEVKGVWHISVREEASAGRANARVRELLAEALAVPPEAFILQTGARSPQKTYLLTHPPTRMQTNYKFTNTPADDKLRAYADLKVAAFSKLLQPDALEGAVCDVEFKESAKHKTGDVCYAEVTLRVAGKVYRAKKEEPTLKKAIDKVKDDILAELRKVKTKTKESARAGAGKAKEMMKG